MKTIALAAMLALARAGGAWGVIGGPCGPFPVHGDCDSGEFCNFQYCQSCSSCSAGTPDYDDSDIVDCTVTCPPPPCDASASPANGGVGNCTNTLASGATCEPTCDAGYTVSGASSCTAGTLTAATCDVNPPPPSAASRLTRAVTVAALLAGALAM